MQGKVTDDCKSGLDEVFRFLSYRQWGAFVFTAVPPAQYVEWKTSYGMNEWVDGWMSEGMNE